jgi:RNA polymerase primary sigma factor
MNKTFTKRLVERVKKRLPLLELREQQILTMRWGLEDGIIRSLEEVGKEFGITKERVRQIESKIIIRLLFNKKYENRTRN